MEDKPPKKVHRPMIKEDWFKYMQINFDQAPDGFVAIHASKDHRCKYFEVPEEWLERDDFFDMIYEKALKLWEKPDREVRSKCPICHHLFFEFHWLYKGKYFCRWCGSHYDREQWWAVITRGIYEV